MEECCKGVDKIMNETRNRINKILSELDSSVNLEGVDSKVKKSTGEIVKLLIGKNAYQESPTNKLVNTKANGFRFDMTELNTSRDTNNEVFELHYYHELGVDRRFLGKIIKFVKRVLRKCMFFLFHPIIEEQNRFNASVTSSINELCNSVIVSQAFIADFQDVKMSLAETGTRIDELLMETQQLKDDLQDTGDEHVQFISRIEKAIDELEKTTEGLDRVTGDIQREIISVHDVVNLVESERDDWKKDILTISEEVREEMHLQSEDVSRKMHLQSEKVNNELHSQIVDLKLGIDERIGEISDNNEKLEMTVYRYMKNNIVLGSEEKRQGEHLSEKIVSENINDKEEKEVNLYSGIDYFEFENKFRGSRINIKKVLSDYLPLFMGKSDVLDLGCGRGEFLELLMDNNISAKGVDLYKDFVDYCGFKGLDVVEGDAIEYLRNTDNESIGGIMCSQVVEHISTERLFELCAESYLKLENGGCIVIETPNPTCLSTFMNSFYLDPSHEKPVHPLFLEYVLQKAGFSNIQIVYTESSKLGRLPLLNASNIENLAEFNDGINWISECMFGSQNYAIVATK